MKLNLRNRPGIKLEHLLKRRRTMLSSFLEKQGITTYETLVERCSRMGCEPPTIEKFMAATSQAVVSSPTEGVVVLEADDVVPGVVVVTGVEEEEEVVDESIHELPAPTVIQTPQVMYGKKKKSKGSYRN